MSRSLVATDPSKPLDNLQQERFIVKYLTEEFFGNGRDAYIDAYGMDKKRKGVYNTAAVGASRLLTNPIILARINYLLENELGLNDAFVDRELAFLITQKADHKTKLGAIKEYNQLKGRIKRKLELSFDDSTDAEIESELHAVEQEISKAEAIVRMRREGRNDTDGMPVEATRDNSASTSDNQNIKDATIIE